MPCSVLVGSHRAEPQSTLRESTEQSRSWSLADTLCTAPCTWYRVAHADCSCPTRCAGAGEGHGRARDRRIAHGRGGRHRDAIARPRAFPNAQHASCSVLRQGWLGVWGVRGVCTRVWARGLACDHRIPRIILLARAVPTRPLTCSACVSRLPCVQRSSQATRS